jgi:hypothetical protein
MYLRKVVGKQNLVQGVAWKQLADPARGLQGVRDKQLSPLWYGRGI